MAPAAGPSLNHSINPSTEAADQSPPHPSMAADPLPTDIPRTIPIVDYLESTVDYTFWRSANGDQEDLPRLPLLWSLSRDRTKLTAIDCLSNKGDPIAHMFPLPVHLHGHELFSSIGNCLLLEKRGSHSGIRLFNPFSSYSSAQVDCLPPSASLMPHPNSDPLRFQIHTIVPDTKRGIALALVGNHHLRMAYTMLDRSGVGGRWIDLTHLVVAYERPFFQTALLYKGLICAVDTTGNTVLALDFSSAPTTVTQVDMTSNLPINFVAPHEHEHIFADWCCYQSASLINTGSSLFLVRWRNTLRMDNDPRFSRAMDVFRLDDNSKFWVRQRSLDDQSFFIGRNLSFSISTVDFPDFPELKSSQVYLCRDAIARIGGNQLSCPYDFDDILEFGYHLLHDVVDGNWSVFYDDEDHVHHNHPSKLTVWMLPPQGASTGPARAVRRTTNKQGRKRKIQLGRPRTRN